MRLESTHVDGSPIPRKPLRMHSYLYPSFVGAVAGATVGARRCPGGRVTKIPYFLGGGSGGKGGGKDGSRIFNAT